MDFPAIFSNKLCKLEKRRGETEVCGVYFNILKYNMQIGEKNVSRQKLVGFPAIFKKKSWE